MSPATEGILEFGSGSEQWGHCFRGLEKREVIGAWLFFKSGPSELRLIENEALSEEYPFIDQQLAFDVNEYGFNGVES